MADAKISVRSDLLKIVEDLKVISETAQATSDSLAAASKQLGSEVNDQVSIVSGGMEKIRKFGQGLVKQLGSDFKGLFSVNALVGGMKLSEQFAGSIKQAVTLNDTIRNLAPIFGMTEDRAERFKRNLVKGLGEIGVGSDAAANALMGLAETPVRGEKALEAYAKTASELASISKEKGQEANIAKGLSGVVTAQGGDPNDPKAMQKVADDIVRIRNATGKSATEALATLSKLFSSANQDFKKRLLQGGGVSLAAAGLIGGQGSTAFLERFMGLSKQERAGYEAQGLGRLVGQNGQLDSKAFESTIAEAKGRGSGNTEFGLKTMGMTDEEAKGFIRLADALRTNGAAVEAARTSVVDINEEYQKTMSLGDSFRASLNHVKGAFTGLMDKIGAPDLINKGTNMLQDASHSAVGSAAVVGGTGLLAAMLTGKGLGGIGDLLGGEAKKAAIESVTGEKVQRVEVINWPASMGGGLLEKAVEGAAGMNNFKNWGKVLTTGGIAGEGAVAAGGAEVAGGGMLAGAAPAAAAVGLGLGAAQAFKYVAGTTEGGGLEASLKELIDWLKGNDNKPKASLFAEPPKTVRVTVDTKNKDLKTFPTGSRGVSQ